MKTILYKGQTYSVKELADLSGIKYTTLCERLKRGYTVDEAVSDNTRIPESVREFVDHSDEHDWDGLTNEKLHAIYWKWCKNNEYTPESIVHFIRCVRQLIPNMRVVTSRVKENGTVNYKRLVRIDKY